MLSNWSSCQWVPLSLILLSSGIQSILSSPSFQSRYPAVCKLLSPCQCCILCCCLHVISPSISTISIVNGHRSDINVKPKSCELTQHFHGNRQCNINTDLKVNILQDNVTRSRDKCEFYEDHWITRLDTKAPHGMNTSLKQFAKTFYELFD